MFFDCRQIFAMCFPLKCAPQSSRPVTLFQIPSICSNSFDSIFCIFFLFCLNVFIAVKGASTAFDINQDSSLQLFHVPWIAESEKRYTWLPVNMKTLHFLVYSWFNMDWSKLLRMVACMYAKRNQPLNKSMLLGANVCLVGRDGP